MITIWSQSVKSGNWFNKDLRLRIACVVGGCHHIFRDIQSRENSTKTRRIPENPHETKWNAEQMVIVRKSWNEVEQCAEAS